MFFKIKLEMGQVMTRALGSCTRTSHPAGTTLRVTDFLKYIPVRRQTALKDVTRNLTRIKKLLHAYAFAHPTLRFSMKVLKAKNENNNWMYAPSADTEIADAAIKIVGRDVSSCCIVKNFPSDSLEPNGYELLAFLPKANAGMQALDHIYALLINENRNRQSQQSRTIRQR